MFDRTRSFLRAPALWGLVVLFAAEFFLFDQFGAHQHTAVYPRWNDQVQYLSECYTGYEFARAHGFARGLWQTLVNPSAQGTLHDFFALIVFAFTGPSRSAALALNMLALIAWQAALWFAVARLSRSRALAFAAAALPLALRGPWQNIPGSAYDFRLDHLAMCALGVTAALGLLTDGLRSRRGSLAFGAAVGITLLTRFLTGTYFVVILAGLAAWTLSSPDRKVRVTNLALAMLVALALAGPIFWLNREWVWNYYYIGHYVGPESAIRDPHLGLGRSLAFVWDNLAQRHLGAFFGVLAASATVAFAIFRAPPATSAARDRAPWIFGALFLLAPALVLTLHKQKSEVVVGALAPGVVTLVVALWLTATRRGTDGPSWSPVGRGIVSASVVAAAFVVFAQRQLAPAYDAATLADIRQVNTLADYVFAHARAAKLPQANIAVGNVTDSLDGQVLRVICYERHHVWMGFQMSLPTGIAEPTTALVFERLTASDFVFLDADDAPVGPYPYDQKLAALRPQLRAWCDTHLRPVKAFTLFGRPAVLYQRPEIPFP
jgi:hypothetical protein